MAVTYDKQQHDYAKRQKLPLVTIAINTRYCPDGKRLGVYEMQGPVDATQHTLATSLELLRNYLRTIHPEHPALLLFAPDPPKLCQDCGMFATVKGLEVCERCAVSPPDKD